MKPAKFTLFASLFSPLGECALPLQAWPAVAPTFTVPTDKLPPRFESFHPKRQQEFLAGRYCAHEALVMLEAHRQKMPGDKILAVGNSRAPIWPEGTVGAISHSDHLVGAIAAYGSDALGVGLDFEAIMTDERGRRLARRVCTPKEWLMVQDRASVEQPLGWWVTLLFSAKESLYKALFPHHQEFVGFQAVDISGVDLDAQSFTYAFSQPLKKPLPLKGHGLFRFLTAAQGGGPAGTVVTACRMQDGED